MVTTINVSNLTELNTAISDAVALSATDTVDIILANGTYGASPFTGETDAAVSVLSRAYVNRVTIKASTPLGATIPSMRVGSSQNVTVRDINMQADWWTEANKPGAIFQYDGNCDGLIVEYCKIRQGYGPSHLDYDVTAEYAEYRAPVNTIAGSTYALRCLNGVSTGDITIRYNTISDVSQAIKPSWDGPNTKSLLIYGNDVRRVYQDPCAIGLGRAYTGKVEVYGNIFWDSFAQPQDSGNPHGDAGQSFWASTGEFATEPNTHQYYYRNIVGQQPNCRGQVQRLLFSGFNKNNALSSRGNYVFENMLLSRMSSVTMQTNVEDGYTYRNTALCYNPSKNTPVGNENNVSPYAPGINPQSSAYAASISVSSSSLNRQTRHFISKNLSEEYSITPLWDQRGGNISTGKASPSALTVYDTYITGPVGGDWNTLTTPEALFNAFTTKVAYAGNGAADAGTDFATWLSGTPDWAAMPFYVGFPNALGQVASSTVESTISRIRGGKAQSRTFTVNIGEHRLLNDFAGTSVAQTWTTSPIVGTVGQYYQVRHTASATPSTTVTQQVSISGETGTFNFASTTQSAVFYPHVNVDSTDDTWLRGNAVGAVCPDGEKGTIMYEFVAATTGTQKTLFGNITGSRGALVDISAAAAIRLFLRNSATTSIFTFDATTLTVTAGKKYRLIASWDSTKAVSADAARIVLVNLTDNTQLARACTAHTVNGQVNYAYGSSSFKINPGLQDGTIGAAFFHNDFIDLTNSANVNKFGADQIGDNGENIFGVTPILFAVGKAADWNDAGGINRGTGSASPSAWTKMVPQGATSVTDADSNTWPPTAAATALFLTGPSSGLAGVASTNFTVNDNGTAVAGVVTPNDGGVGGVFSPASIDMIASPLPQTFTYTPPSAYFGLVDINLTNTGGLVNPASINYESLEQLATTVTLGAPSSGTTGSPMNIVAGVDGRLTAAQAITLTAPVAGTWVPSNIVNVDDDNRQGFVQFTPSAAGSGNFTATATGLTDATPVAATITDPSPSVTPRNSALGLSFGLRL